uniref:39S ribosomal protein L34, mitochondrial n=1 Tax=Ursus americanus TaxID=9643 RepID=A0A452SBF9_URSAM
APCLAGSLLLPLSRGLQLGPIRCLQPEARLGLSHAWGLPATPRDWDKVHGIEYQRNNIKRKHKHHWTGVGAQLSPFSSQIYLPRVLSSKRVKSS